jgi:hypothetical protein
MEFRRMLVALLLLILIGTPSCIHLTGQRITIVREGAEGDLVLLMHCDGIYTTEGGSRIKLVAGGTGGSDGAAPARPIPDSVKQFEDYVAKGGICLFGWLTRIDMASMRAVAEGREEADNAEAKAVAAAFVRHVSTEIVGRYRDMDDRSGWLQILRIERPGEFFEVLNRCANASLVRCAATDGLLDDTEKYPATAERFRKAAEEGWEWVRLEGHAFSFRFPVDEREWMMLKREGLRELCGQLLGDLGKRMGTGEENSVTDRHLKSLAPVTSMLSTPFSLCESGGTVTFTLGDPAKPNTLRFMHGDAAERHMSNMNSTVTRCIPGGLDREIAHLLIRKELPEPGHPLHTLFIHGPPEAQVRALLNVCLAQDKEAEKAFETLLRWGKEWNERASIPKAPVFAETQAGTLEEWKDWYRDMILFPVRS